MRCRSTCRGAIIQDTAVTVAETRVTVQDMWKEASLRVKDQLDPSRRFDTTPACDGETDGQRHRP